MLLQHTAQYLHHCTETLDKISKQKSFRAYTEWGVAMETKPIGE